MTLTIEHLSVTLRGRLILNDLSFEATRGEFLILVGPNGAGKTTLLKAIAGLIDFAGSIRWGGMPIAKMRPAERAKTIAYLPQGHMAAWPIKARDVVAIGRAPFASSLGRLSEEDETAIDRALCAVEANSFANRPVTELSGGERARIMLARALASGGNLLLADEPVTSLDPAHQLSVMSVLESEARRGRLVIGVSHDLMLAARFASRVLVLSEKTIVAQGTPEQTLTSDLLQRVFDVDALAIKAGTLSLNIPWMPSVSNRVASSKI